VVYIVFIMDNIVGVRYGLVNNDNNEVLSSLLFELEKHVRGDVSNDNEYIGNLASKNTKKYVKRALRGDIKSQFQLAIGFHFGKRGVEQSFEDALLWYWVILSKTSPTDTDEYFLKVMNNIGVMYLTGKGLPKSEAAAFQWWSCAELLMRSMKNTDLMCSSFVNFNLAMLAFMSEDRTLSDYPQAISRMRSLKDDPITANNLASMNALGLGIDFQDTSRADRMFEYSSACEGTRVSEVALHNQQVLRSLGCYSKNNASKNWSIESDDIEGHVKSFSDLNLEETAPFSLIFIHTLKICV